MEIKFRGLSHSSGWVYGSYIHSKRFIGCSNEHRIFNQDTGLESDVIGETVGQFTGLTDKNGKEIYSGDILKGGVFKSYIVKWDKDQCGFNIGNAHKEYEIIGNKFEHPNFLRSNYGT